MSFVSTRGPQLSMSLSFAHWPRRPTPALLEAGATRYDELLDGMVIRQESFQGWLDEERGALAQHVANVLAASSPAYAKQSRWPKAIEAAER
jgi:hypothetical protein